MPRVQVSGSHSGRHAGPGFDDEPTEPYLIDPVPVDIITPMSTRGLAKFDLGSVPASVTPPRSWRRAAWFAVTSAVAVLVGLVFMTTSMVGPPAPVDRINALPDYSGALLSDVPGPSGSAAVDGGRGAQQAASHQSDHRAPGSGAVAPPTAGRSATSGHPVTSDTIASGSDPTGSPIQPYPPTSFPPPTTTTVPPKQAFGPVSDPKQMTDTTQSYLEKVATNPDAASSMTTGSLREEGAAGIRQRYRDAKAVRVERISANPNDGTTTDRITIYRRDRSTVTEVRKLTFSHPVDPNTTPQITADSQAS
ncbi:MAG: hypothetical protein ACRDRN_07370 [Sciscionella sp.]